MRHSLPWEGRGDIDSVAIAPTGVGIVIETKTRTYERLHLTRVSEQAVCCPAAGEGGAAAALRQFCALFELVECSGVRTTCWWSRSIA